MKEPAIARQTIGSAVADRLRARILQGEVAPGEPLRQEALAAELGVSRIPVREALRALAAEGLVVLEPHKGAVVSGLSAAEISELFDLRGLIEVDLLARAVPNHDAASLALARDVLEGYEATLQTDDVAEWGLRNWRFHEALYRPARRPRTLAILQGISEQTERFVRLQLALTRRIDRAIAEHRELLRLTAAGEVAAATDLLARHIAAARDSLIAALKGAD